eukprot:gene43431-58835_t
MAPSASNAQRSTTSGARIETSTPAFTVAGTNPATSRGRPTISPSGWDCSRPSRSPPKQPNDSTTQPVYHMKNIFFTILRAIGYAQILGALQGFAAVQRPGSGGGLTFFALLIAIALSRSNARRHALAAVEAGAPDSNRVFVARTVGHVAVIWFWIAFVSAILAIGTAGTYAALKVCIASVLIFGVATLASIDVSWRI